MSHGSTCLARTDGICRPRCEAVEVKALGGGDIAGIKRHDTTGFAGAVGGIQLAQLAGQGLYGLIVRAGTGPLNALARLRGWRDPASISIRSA